MSDNFITTMAARTIGEIPTVEPLTHPIYLPLPAMPGDYSEDASWEPEPSASMDDEPDLSFMPLVTSEGWSVTMPRWDETQELGIVETWDENPVQELDSEVTPRVEPLQDVGKVWEANQSVEEGGRQEDTRSWENGDTYQGSINTEAEVTFTEVIQQETDSKSQPTETSEYPIVPQVNQLEVLQNSVEPDVHLDVQASRFEAESYLELNDTTNHSYNQLSEIENGDTQKYGEAERVSSGSGETVTPESKVSKEISPIPIAPQVNPLEVPPQSVEANVEFTSPISTSKPRFKQVSDDTQSTVSRQFTNLENGETTTSINLQSGNSDDKKSDVNSSNLTRETETSPTIAPQVNRLEVPSQSVEANVEFDLPGSTSESGFTQVPDDTQSTVNRQFTNLENGETTTSTNLQSGNNDDKQSDVNSSNLNRGTETSPTIAPQVNRLEVPSQSVGANVEFELQGSTSESGFTQVSDDTQLNVNRQFTNQENGETHTSSEVERRNTSSNQPVIHSSDVLKELETPPKIAPQVNRLEVPSQSVEANVELTSPISNSESGFTQVSDDTQATINRQFTNQENGETHTSSEVERRNTSTNQPVIHSSDVLKEVETPPKIAPQVNRLEVPSQSVEANVELISPISNSEPGVTQASDDTQSTVNRQFTNIENGETTTSTNLQSGNSKDKQSDVNSSNLTKETETPPTILPQVNRLEVPSQSVEANVEFTSTTSNSESELHQALNNTHKPLHRQLTNTENSPVEANAEIHELNVDTVQNINASKTSRKEVFYPASNHLKPQFVKRNVELTSPESISQSELHSVSNNTQSSPPRKLIDPRKQQIQKHDDVNRRKITEETFTPNLVNASEVTNQVKPTLQERTFAPQVNRVHIVKHSAKPEIELTSTQLHLQSPLQPEVAKRQKIPEKPNPPTVKSSVLDNTQFSKQSQLSNGEINRSKATEQKATLQKMVKVGTDNSALVPSPPIILNSRRLYVQSLPLSQTPISSTQQSVEPNVYLNSTSAKSDSRKVSSPEHPKTELFKNITLINTDNTENFADPRITQTPDSRTRVNPSRHELVIPLKDNSENLLSPPKVESSSLAHNQPQPRRHQLEPPSLPTPTIQVTIGRIEVRVTQPPASPKPKAKQSQKRSPAMTLSDYLKQRNGK